MEVVDLGEEYNHIPLIMCGHFTGTSDNPDLPPATFRDLILDAENGNCCSIIVPEVDPEIPGNWGEYRYETDVIFE